MFQERSGLVHEKSEYWLLGKLIMKAASGRLIAPNTTTPGIKDVVHRHWSFRSMRAPAVFSV